MYSTISIDEFKKLLETQQPTIIDVRGPLAYDQFHIENAQSIPLMTLPDAVQDLDQDTTYYIVCQHGVSSDKACQFLAQQGFQVINILEGMSAW